jgi:Acetyl-CoA carboxylase, central region
MSLNLRCPRVHGVFDLRSKSEFLLSRVSCHQIHCSTASYEVSPRHLSHGPSHLRGISSLDTSDNLSGDNGDASCASEIGSYRIGVLAAFSNLSDLASNFNEVLEKYTSRVHLTPGADIDATTVLLRRDDRNSASALDPINESTAAVPNIADPLVCERQVRSRLVDFCRANRSRYKNARVACLKTISYIVAPTTPGGQSVTYSLFFTFRVRDNCEEDPIFRHFDPSTAYQVEHARLLNFKRTKLTQRLQLLVLYEGFASGDCHGSLRL